MKELEELSTKLDAVLAEKEAELNDGEGTTTNQWSLIANRRRDIGSFKERASKVSNWALESRTVIENFTKTALEIITEIQAI